MPEPEFQYIIRDISQAAADGEDLTLSHEETVKLLEGFAQMAENLTNSADIIESLEADVEELESKAKKPKRMWLPT